MPLVNHLQFNKAFVSACFALALCLSSSSASLAGTTNTMAVPVTPPGVPPLPGAPPPIGSGSIPPPLTSGDIPGSNQPPPSGNALNGYPGGSKFDHESLSSRSIVNILMNVGDPATTFGEPPVGDNRQQAGGEHVVLTFRPATLTSSQLAEVEDILGTAFDPTLPYQNITASEDQITQLQEVFAPYPPAPKEIPNGPNTAQHAKSLSFFSQPGSGYPKYESTPWFIKNSALPNAGSLESGKLSYKSQLTTVRGFCRYLVLLGVVFASLYMVMAAYGVVQGQRDAGSRVTAAAGGLILLLMSYSIWKIVATNSSRFPDTQNQARNPRWREPGERSVQNQSTYVQPSPSESSNTTSGQVVSPPNTTPSPNPALPKGYVPRSNMPIVPLLIKKGDIW